MMSLLMLCTLIFLPAGFRELSWTSISLVCGDLRFIFGFILTTAVTFDVLDTCLFLEILGPAKSQSFR